MRILMSQASFSYAKRDQEEKKALAGIDLTVSSGERLGLVGASGSGKSTLLQLMNGLLLPTEGEVVWEENGHRPLSAREARKSVGVVFQYPESQLFAENVGSDVCFGPLNLGCDSEEAEARARWALTALELNPDAFWHRSPFALSGGEQRKVAIAGVLAMKPKVLALDEPTAGLDWESRSELLALLDRYQKDSGCSLIMVSHDLEEVSLLCQRLAVLFRGAKVHDGLPGELGKEKLEEWGVGQSQLQELLLRLRQKGIELPASLESLDAIADFLLEGTGN